MSNGQNSISALISELEHMITRLRSYAVRANTDVLPTDVCVILLFEGDIDAWGEHKLLPEDIEMRLAANRHNRLRRVAVTFSGLAAANTDTLPTTGAL